MVVAFGAETRAIGKGPDLLWRISDDLRRFKSLTTGHAIIMGRKTYESIGRPLPNRTNIIVTRQAEYAAPGCVVCPNIDEAIRRAFETERASLHAPEAQEVFICGGGEIYTQALPLTDRIYATLVESDTAGDIFFPEYVSTFTNVLRKEEHFDEKTGLKYTWIDLEK